MKIFLKGFIVGIGGIAPGLSGSVLMIIFGIYQKTLEALGNLFTHFRQSVHYLAPILSGMLAGVLMFSKVIDFFLEHFEMPTRFCFLGLILGTVPLIYKEVKKEGFSARYYGVILCAALIGTCLFTVHTDTFPQIHDPGILASVILGIAVAATAIIPGIDPAVLLSTLGLYEAYVSALADFNLQVLLPMLIGLGAGAVAVSAIMNLLFQKFYTAVYSVIFGIFLSMIPNMLNEHCVLGYNKISVLSIILMAAGFLISYNLGKKERKDNETND